MARSIAVVVICWIFIVAQVAAQEPRFAYVDLEAKFTHKLVDKFEGDDRPGNFLTLPQGEKTFENIKFRVGDGIIQLGSKVMVDKPEKVVGTKVDKKFTKLHILHSNCYGGGPNTPGAPWYVEDDAKIGEYKVNYEDKSAEYIPIVFGRDVRDWWFRDDEAEASRSKVAWKGDNELAAKYGCRLRLYLSTWKNPKPDLKVVSIDYIGQKEATVAAPFCVALTLEEQPSKEEALAAEVQQLEKRITQLESVIKTLQGKGKESPKSETEVKLVGNWTVADSERTTQGICTDLKLNADGTGKAVVNQPEGRWGSMKYDLVGKELQLTEERANSSYFLAVRVKSADVTELVLEYALGEKSRQVRYSRE